MNKLDIFSISFYEFTCNDELTDRILSKVKNLSWIPNTSNSVTTTDLFFDVELFDWFDNCLEKVKNEIGLPKEISVPITSCWANRTTKMQAHHSHNHPNSFISGIFYLTSHECGHTYFAYPNYWMQKLPDLKFKNPIVGQHYKILPKKSTLLLFPSNIQHSVIGMKNNEPRYTIAFNTYLNGEIDDGSALSRLYINTKSVRDHNNET